MHRILQYAQHMIAIYRPWPYSYISFQLPLMIIFHSTVYIPAMISSLLPNRIKFEMFFHFYENRERKKNNKWSKRNGSNGLNFIQLIKTITIFNGWHHYFFFLSNDIYYRVLISKEQTIHNGGSCLIKIQNDFIITMLHHKQRPGIVQRIVT